MILPPSHWKKLPSIEFVKGEKAASAWAHKLISMTVIRSKSRMTDGSEWLHVSVSRPDRLPSWAEVSKVKEEFIGPFYEAFHIVPKASDHVNVHSYCLHLWSPIGKTQSLPNLQNLEWEEEI